MRSKDAAKDFKKNKGQEELHLERDSRIDHIKASSEAPNGRFKSSLSTPPSSHVGIWSAPMIVSRIRPMCPIQGRFKGTTKDAGTAVIHTGENLFGGDCVLTLITATT